MIINLNIVSINLKRAFLVILKINEIERCIFYSVTIKFSLFVFKEEKEKTLTKKNLERRKKKLVFCLYAPNYNKKCIKYYNVIINVEIFEWIISKRRIFTMWIFNI